MNNSIKTILLANFCDGDSWEDADATSFTKDGVLEIAEFFYHQALQDGERAMLVKVLTILQDNLNPRQSKQLEALKELLKDTVVKD